MNKLQHYSKLIQDFVELNLTVSPEYKIKTKELKELFDIDNTTLSNVIIALRKKNYTIIRNEGEITFIKEKPKQTKEIENDEEVFKPTHPFIKYRTRS